jgi:MSHA biogenesis protein MshP
MTPHFITTRIGFARKSARAQRGIGLVTAIFLLVVLAGLGAAIVNFSITQHTSAALDEQGSHAYQAAKAGIEWGLYRELIDGNCAAGPVSFVPPAPTLSTFTVTVTCSRVTYANANPQIRVSRIRSVACNIPNGANCPGTGGQPDYVQRVVDVTF